MANTLLTSNVIAKEMLNVLENELVFAKGVNRQYEKEFEGDRKVGDTVMVRKPARYTVRSGKTLQVQDHEESQVPVTLDSQEGVDVQFSSKELTLNLDDFSKQVIKPQMAALANKIDLSGMLLYKKIANTVGTPGTLPASMKVYATAGALMSQEAAPLDDRRIILDPMSQVELIDAQKGLFQSASQIKEQYEKGVMGTAAGFEFSMSQNVPTHMVGPQGGAPQVAAVPAEGATQLSSKGWTAAASARLNVGDVFTIPGVFAVNPQSRMSTGQLRRFVVTAAFSSAADGTGLISIYPAITSTGKNATVTKLPAINDALTVIGAANTPSPTNLAFCKNAFTLVSAELPLPGGMDMASRVSSKKTGLSIRFIRGYDIQNDLFVSRCDILYGYGVLYPELACRIQG